MLTPSNGWLRRGEGIAVTAEANKTVIQRINEEFWNGRRAAVLSEVFAPDVVDHFPAPGQAPGREGVISANLMFLSAFPDLRMTVNDMIAEGDLVAWRWTAEGTHSGPLMGMGPTNRAALVHGVSIDRFLDGVIAERWLELDMLGLLGQLGAIEPPAG